MPIIGVSDANNNPWLTVEQPAKITGLGFGAAQGSVRMKPSNLNLPVTTWSDTEIVFEAPAAAIVQLAVNSSQGPLFPILGSVTFTVFPNGASSMDSAPTQIIIPPPVVKNGAISPNPITPGDTMTIGGPVDGSDQGDNFGLKDRGQIRIYSVQPSVPSPPVPLTPAAAPQIASYIASVQSLLQQGVLLPTNQIQSWHDDGASVQLPTEQILADNNFFSPGGSGFVIVFRDGIPSPPISFNLTVQPLIDQLLSQVPEVLALFDNDNPPWTFLAVPPGSPLDGVASDPAANDQQPMTVVPSALQSLVQSVTNIIGSLTNLGPAAQALGLPVPDTSALSLALSWIVTHIGNPTPKIFIIRAASPAGISDLNHFQYHWSLGHNETAEDAMDALAFMGPPGSRARCFNDKDLKTGQGELDIVVDNLAASVIYDLSKPAGTHVGGSITTSGASDFHDSLSSIGALSPGS